MNPVVKSSLAILFVGGLATVLAYPLVSEVGGDGARLPVHEPQDKAKKKDKQPAVQSSPEPSPAPEDPGEPGLEPAFRHRPFLAPVPEVCLRRERGRGGADLVAATEGGRVVAATTGGVPRFSFAGSAPVGWSVGGRYLATGDGAVRDGRGRRMGPLFGGVSVTAWAWSPVAQCGLGLRAGGGGLVLGRPHWGTRTLVRDGVESFSFSPDGRTLAYLRRETDLEQPVLSLWMARLGTSRTREVVRFPPETTAARLGGWRTAAQVWLWAGLGESILADGAHPWSVSVAGPTRVWRAVTTLAHPTFLVPCGGRVVAVAGAGRETIADKAIAFLAAPRRATVASDRSFAYLFPSCSPDGSFIAAVRAPEGTSPDERRLVLLDSDGELVRELTGGDDLADEVPEWGPRGTGVLFVRRSTGSGGAEMWFIPEGGAARATGLTADVPRPFYGFYDWTPLVDWSATRPTGFPAR